MSEKTELAIVSPDKLALTFQQPQAVDETLTYIEAEIRKQTAKAPDLSTLKGRKEIASLAYKIARSKTAWDEAGKNLNADLHERIKVVDAERRKIRARLDALKDEVRAPLDEWEAAEDARVEKLKARLARLRDIEPAEETSDTIKSLISRVEAAVIDESWQEYLPQAAAAKDATLARLRNQLTAVEQREAEQAELERLRAEAAAREEAERQRKDAEAEAERQAKIERERHEAEQRAREQAEREAKERADAERKAQAERERKAAEEQAAKEAEWQRQLDEANRKAEAAAQAERDRLAAEAKAEADARQKREADAAHRARIVAAIAASLRTYGDAAPEEIAEAIVSGMIPLVHVTF